MNETKCLHCGKIIPADHCCYGGPHGALCMPCGDSEFTIYTVCLAGEKTGESHISPVAALESLACLTEGDEDNEGFHVIKSKMSGAKYYSLPEFDGF